jgi:ABC-type multidrug transport system fused ATPase/permease subunit
MLKRDRQALLHDLGDQRLETAWDPKLGFFHGFAWYMLFLYGPAMFAVAYLPFDKDAMVAVWSLSPLPFAVIAWVWHRHQNRESKIVFDQKGFEFVNHGSTKASYRWSEIERITRFRQTLTVIKTSGDSSKAYLPQSKASRNKSWFKAIISTYFPYSDVKIRAKKMAKFCLIFGSISLGTTLIMGRPRVMQPGFDFPFVLLDFIHMGAWALTATGSMALLLGIMSLIETLTPSKPFENEQELEAFDPFEARVEKDFGWILPINLEVGKSYRYFDPERLAKDIRIQTRSQWILIVVILFGSVLLGFIAVLSKSEPGMLVTCTVMALGLGATSGLPGSYLVRMKRNQSAFQDIILVKNRQIDVSNGHGSRSYSLPGKSVGIDGLVAYRTSLAPFETYDQYGQSPITYALDRRYLIECESTIKTV